MKASSEEKTETSVAARIAGEDIQIGDFVTIFNEVVELPSYLWACSGMTLPMEEPVRLRYMPRTSGTPHKVVAVCLPFVYARPAEGKLETFDTRRQQLVRLDQDNARRVWKRLGGSN